MQRPEQRDGGHGAGDPDDGAANVAVTVAVEARALPGPAGAPFIGSFLHVAGNRPAFLLRLRTRYGRTVGFRVRGRQFILLSDPEDVKCVLGSHAAKYGKGVGHQEARAVLRDGLLTSDGAVWAEHHERLAPLFRNLPTEQDAGEIERIARETAEAWCHRGRVDVAHELAVTALRVAALVFLGADLRERAPEIVNLFASFEKRSMAAMVAGLLAPGTIAGRLPEVWVAPYRRKLLALLSDVDLTSTRVGASFEGCPRSELEDEVLTLLYTGYDTASAAMTSALGEIASRPEVLQTIAGELDEVRRSRTLLLSIQETLRLHPPVWLIPRQALEEDGLRTCTVARGTHVLISPYVLHRDPEHWSRPNAFDPLRFERTPADNGPFLPFGTGPRRCIGSALAMMQMTTVLDALLRKLTIAPRNKMRHEALLTLRPRKLKVDVRARP